jgi:hypothetical protein
MPKKSHFLETDAQTVLDDMWDKGLTPFKMNVGKFTVDEDGYLIEFYDSRIHSLRIPLVKGRPWKEVVRDAVLKRVAQMSGPLTPKKKE